MNLIDRSHFISTLIASFLSGMNRRSFYLISLVVGETFKECSIFMPDKKEAIRVEIKWLLAVEFIKEVYYPEWLANPVLVQKRIKNRECVSNTLISTNTTLKTPWFASDRRGCRLHRRL